MLDINITIKGDTIVIKNINMIAKNLPQVLNRRLKRVAKGIHRYAHDFLSGPGAKKSYIPAGGFPVPVRTGHIRRMLDWLEPGESKSGDAGTFTAGRHEVVIYDSATYSDVIHEGTHSSAKFGRRPFLENAFKVFNQGDRIRRDLEGDINNEIKKRGLK